LSNKPNNKSIFFSGIDEVCNCNLNDYNYWTEIIVNGSIDVPEVKPSIEEIDLSGEKSVADAWILTRLNETIEQVTKLADKYEFGEVGRSLYNFIWDVNVRRG